MSGKRQDIKETHWVCKSNKLIESRGYLSSLEQKIFATVVSMIKPEDKDFQEYHLQVKDFSDMLATNSNNTYDMIKKASQRLKNAPVDIEEINEKGKRHFKSTNLFASAEYEEGSGFITYTVAPLLKPYLLELISKDENNKIKIPYTKYRLENILKLKGSHSIRLYELLAQYSGMKEKVKKRVFEVEELKTILGLNNQYKSFTDFEKKVLEKGKQEINDKTNIFMNFEKIKKGRSYTHIIIEFEMRYTFEDIENQEKQILQETGAMDYISIINNSGLSELSISKKQIEKMYEIACEKTDPILADPYKYIELTYEFCKIKQAEGNVENMIAYMIKALNKDFGHVLKKINKNTKQ